MRVCDCLVRGDEGEEGGGSRAAFSGMVMEKINGGWAAGWVGAICALVSVRIERRLRAGCGMQHFTALL
jgi:hypothetical protein